MLIWIYSKSPRDCWLSYHSVPDRALGEWWGRLVSWPSLTLVKPWETLWEWFCYSFLP